MANLKFVPALTAQEDIEQMREEYANANRFENILVGEQHLFFPSITRVRYVTIRDIVWSYMRRENRFCSSGCRRVLVPIPCLVIVLSTGKKKAITFEDEKHITSILTKLKEINANLCVGYTDEYQKRFAPNR